MICFSLLCIKHRSKFSVGNLHGNKYDSDIDSEYGLRIQVKSVVAVLKTLEERSVCLFQKNVCISMISIIIYD